MKDHWCNAIGVLKVATLNLLSERLGAPARNLVDGWAATDPKGLKAMEADGTLLETAMTAQEEATNAEQRAIEAYGGKMPPLSATEIYELFGGPSHRSP